MNELLGGNIMKINKSILTGMTALSLFATSATAVTSAVTPVVSHAAEKTETKYTHYLSIVKSKGHATKYFDTRVYFDKTQKQLQDTKSNWILGNSIDGYKRTNDATYYKLINNKMYKVGNSINTYYSKDNKATNSEKMATAILYLGTSPVSKKTFNKIKSQITVKGSVKAPKKYSYAVKTLNTVKSKGHPTKYFYMVANYAGTKAQLKKGSFCWYRPVDFNSFGYKTSEKKVFYYLKGNHLVRRGNYIPALYKKNGKAITKDDMADIIGTCRYNDYSASEISKAEFNKLNKEQTR